MKTKVLLSLLVTLLIFTPAFAKLISITSQNSASHIEYTLTCLQIPVKRKVLPVDAKLDLQKANAVEGVSLHSIFLESKFTSVNPIFRRIINQEKYPGFVFSSTLHEPIVIKEKEPVEIDGNLTFHGVTKNIKINFENNSDGNNIDLIGNININMKDFGIHSPLLRLILIDKVIKAKIELHGAIVN